MWKHSRKMSWRILQTMRKLGQAKLAGKCILLYPPLQISLLGPLGEWHQNSSCPAYLPESLQQISYNMLLSKMQEARTIWKNTILRGRIDEIYDCSYSKNTGAGKQLTLPAQGLRNLQCSQVLNENFSHSLVRLLPKEKQQ